MTCLASAGTSTGVEVSTSSTGAEPRRFLELVKGGHRQRPGDVDRVVVRPGAAMCVPLGRLLDGKSAVHLDRTRRQCPQPLTLVDAVAPEVGLDHDAGALLSQSPQELHRGPA
jgi:hypothetical protein